jgi:hypothetical protein
MVYATEHIHSVVVTNCILQLAIYFWNFFNHDSTSAMWWQHHQEFCI